EGVAIDATVAADAVLGARAQLVDRPARLGNADHRHGETPAARHAVKRRKNLLVGQVAGRPEEDERVGRVHSHDHTSLGSRSRSTLGGVAPRSKHTSPPYWSNSATSAVQPV